MEFEWDPDKAASNLYKHGVSFVAAISVFDDPWRIEADSTKPEHGEMRRKTIGQTAGGLLIAVIFTDRVTGRRVISARKVRKNEQAQYERNRGNSG